MLISFQGGPAGSGINLARLHGRNLQTIVDSSMSPKDDIDTGHIHKYFDIISFDPRGIGHTTPTFICFPDAVKRMEWEIASDAEGLLGSSDVAFDLMWARKHALAEACFSRASTDDDGKPGIGAFMSTPVVAMDMKAIVEALSRSKTHHSQHRDSLSPSVVDEAAKIKYWGFSYGTILGETFAARYPNLIGRVVLDGVSEAERHYAGKSC